MFDSLKELLDKIRLGEDTFLEYKEVRFSGGRVTDPHRDSLADELAAFANSRGGVFVMGVEDRTHEILGIPLGPPRLGGTFCPRSFAATLSTQASRLLLNAWSYRQLRGKK